ncbi:hypothetical protein [Anaerocolumna xylanovorans]|uniref:Uncharacterized protein n=1 Tax=Anaerocolumna xylanovorans DSM 12503 TaxID=1121345 RepID=A0A1M7YC87_9FIRM|nr:hypothetical protein [Anaerocolumna xylanovorans]SHO50262.1 hypothetical protein SAMN02745217_02661 [Anaerocolumna xylanovorans DSM 12503]
MNNVLDAVNLQEITLEEMEKVDGGGIGEILYEGLYGYMLGKVIWTPAKISWETSQKANLVYGRDYQ